MTVFIPLVTGGNIGAPAIKSWLRTCPWCGRGANLHLDSADPNCRCQQDSVLVTSLHFPAASGADMTPVNTNNQPPTLGKPKKTNKKTTPLRIGRNAISVTPSRLDQEDLRDGKDSQPEPLTPDRPASVQSTEQYPSNKKHRSKNHRSRKYVAGEINHPPDTVFNSKRELPIHNDKYGYQNTTTQPSVYVQRVSGYTSGKWQALTSNQQPYYSVLHPHYQHPHQHPPPQPTFNSRGLQGSNFHSNRVKSILAQKSAPGALIKMWHNSAYQDIPSHFHPLAVTAQRRTKYKQHNYH